MPLRHGLTVMQRFRPLAVSGELTEQSRTAGRTPTAGLAEAVPVASGRGRRFRYARIDGTVLAPAIALEPGGAIGGYRHWNEASWAIVNGCLVFKDGNGVALTVFDTMTGDGTGSGFALHGRFVPDRDQYRSILTTVD